MREAAETQKSTRTNRQSHVVAAEISEGTNYQPRSRETRSAYNVLTSKVKQHIGDVPTDVLHGAVYEVICILKREQIPFEQKQKQLESVMVKVEGRTFNHLVLLTQ